MSAVQTIAVIGGGPAGVTAAERLLDGAHGSASEPGGLLPESLQPVRRTTAAASALRVLVFEEKRGWEKPCGGGLTWKALERYPFLAEATVPARTVREIEIVAPRDQRLRIGLRKPIGIYSRRELNALLLSRAERAGAEVVEDRIVRLESAEGGWRLEGRRGKYAADFVVLAAGARTRLRGKLAGDLGARDFMLTLGYYVPTTETLLRVECFPDFDGYAWSFPRTNHLSVGICGKADEYTMPELKRKLQAFAAKFGYSLEGAEIFAHLLPSLSTGSWRELRLVGPGWALAGDAAGLVDPLTGEGIYFAMRSGELLAESLLAWLALEVGRDGDPRIAAGPDRGLRTSQERTAKSPGTILPVVRGYAESVLNEFGSMLMLGARASPHFYHGEFMGDAVTVRLVQLARHSRTFMNLLQDLIEGRQTYQGLVRRVYRCFPRAIWEMASGPIEARSAGHRAA